MNGKSILVTGADGNLGGRFIRLLADSTDLNVLAVSSFPERIPLMMEREGIARREKITVMSSEEMFGSRLSGADFAGAVHFAFSRAIFPNRDIANSLDYSLSAFSKVADSGIPRAVYISSQSVYGDTSEWRTEATVPAPGSVYAMAKYAGEKLFEACYKGRESLEHTVVRLDIVIQSQKLVRALCKSALTTGRLTLRGGRQVFSYLDADDVPRALLALIRTDKPWRPVYNVGPNRMRYNLEQIASFVQKAGEKRGLAVTVTLDEDDTQLWAGMDSSAFMADTGFSPAYDIEQMIDRIFAETEREVAQHG